MSLRVLIVDDEELARLRLRGLVNECVEPTAHVAGEATNTAQALAWLAGNPCDMLLLDVHMPGRDGLHLAQELRKLPTPPAVVFVTAHAEHAVRACDLEAVDYLTKPVRRDRLHAALLRVAQRLAMQRAQSPTAEPPALTDDAAAQVIVVNDRGRVRRVPVTEVLYFKAELKYVTLRTEHHTFVLDETLSELEHRLGPRFLRVHRNALVACAAVRALERHTVAGEEEGSEGWAVCMATVNEWLAVSRRQVAAVRDALRGAAPSP